jgi:hypothetical protein
MLDACADINNIRARAESKKLTSGGIIRNRPRETAAFFVVNEEDDKREGLSCMRREGPRICGCC